LRKLQLDAMASDVSLVEEKVLDLLNYYKFLRMYQTRSNEALTDQETQKNNKELEDILLVCVPFLPERKDAYQKRLDY
jgi:predicted ATP-binding protein involved in virulence